MSYTNLITMKTLYFNTRDELIKVDLKYVMYFESDGNYTHVHFTNGCEAMLLISLTHLEELIDNKLKGSGQPFIRIGKKYIVNSLFIFHINVPKQQLVLTDFLHTGCKTLAISKEALKQIKNLYRTKENNGDNNR